MNENPFSNTGDTAVATAAHDLRTAANDFAKTTGEQATHVKERAIEAANAIKASAVQKAEQFKTVASEKAEQFKTIASEKAMQFKTVASEKASHAKEVAQQQWDETRVKAKEIHVTAEDYIRQNPTKSVLGALGIGVLIGLIVRR